MRKLFTISILSILFLAVSVFATGPLFKGQIVCTGGDYYYAICAAELDNDGDPDLIASDVDNNSVNVFLTQADGSFTEPVSYNINGSSYAIASGDFNGDGYNDIVVNREIGYDEYLGVLINNGDGTFKPPVDYEAYNDADDIVTADFDGDDNIDILASTHQYAELYINNGDGTFATAIDIAAAYNMNTGLAAADFDGDNDIDFAINNYEFDSTQVFLNDGSGGFAAGVRYPSYSAPNGLEAALLNNDAYPDLIITNNSTNKVTILLNDGDGTFAAPVQYTVGSGAYQAAPGDYDGDGNIDIAVSTWAGKGVSLLFNNGDGTFGAAVHYKDAESPALTSGDFDKDGFLDLAVATGFDLIIIMYNNGDGSFYVNPGLPVGTYAWSVATGDYDNDDDVDMAVTNFTSNNVTLLLNNGDSTFNTLVFAGLPTGAGPKGITMADIDGNVNISVEIGISFFSFI
ncbi:MAG: VCBS repeat-containing protein [candidate division Zixibacteria bacterium]|nr:VCBS repeat-containing protein [candidate division Zixibacteria bacterium]